jgi:hypothetical protein
MLCSELMAILDIATGRRSSPRREVIKNALAGPRNQAKPLIYNMDRRLLHVWLSALWPRR